MDGLVRVVIAGLVWFGVGHGAHRGAAEAPHPGRAVSAAVDFGLATMASPAPAANEPRGDAEADDESGPAAC